MLFFRFNVLLLTLRLGALFVFYVDLFIILSCKTRETDNTLIKLLKFLFRNFQGLEGFVFAEIPLKVFRIGLFGLLYSGLFPLILQFKQAQYLTASNLSQCLLSLSPLSLFLFLFLLGLFNLAYQGFKRRIKDTVVIGHSDNGLILENK
jgi:hypothetical protein